MYYTDIFRDYESQPVGKAKLVFANEVSIGGVGG